MAAKPIIENPRRKTSRKSGKSRESRPRGLRVSLFLAVGIAGSSTGAKQRFCRRGRRWPTPGRPSTRRSYLGPERFGLWMRTCFPVTRAGGKARDKGSEHHSGKENSSFERFSILPLGGRLHDEAKDPSSLPSADRPGKTSMAVSDYECDCARSNWGERGPPCVLCQTEAFSSASCPVFLAAANPTKPRFGNTNRSESVPKAVLPSRVILSGAKNLAPFHPRRDPSLRSG